MLPSNPVSETPACPYKPEANPSRRNLNFTDLAVQAHPNGFYRALREGDPIHHDEALGMYLVSRYKEIDIVLRDPIAFSQERGYCQ